MHSWELRCAGAGKPLPKEDKEEEKEEKEEEEDETDVAQNAFGSFFRCEVVVVVPIIRRRKKLPSDDVKAQLTFDNQKPPLLKSETLRYIDLVVRRVVENSLRTTPRVRVI